MIGRHADLTLYRDIFRSEKFIKTAFGGILIPVTLGLSRLPDNYASFWISALLLLSVAINGLPIVMEAFQGLIKKRINVDELVSIAIIACLINGNFMEAATVSFIMVCGALIEEAVSDSARKTIQGLVEISPDVAIVEVNGREIEKKVADLAINDIVLVRPGDIIPVDGVILTGETAVDESSLTGESIPVNRTQEDDVSAGTLNIDGFIKISARKIGRDSTIGKVIELVKSAELSKAESARIVDQYAAFFTPFILTVAIVTFIITREIDRAITVLIVGCPCSFLLAGPVATVAAIGRAAKAGILVKGGAYLEKIATARAVFFDKTGTLTTGEPRVISIIRAADQKEALPDGEKLSDEGIICLAASVEYGSKHPLARAILRKAEELGCRIDPAENMTTRHGIGVSGIAGGSEIWVGSCEDDTKFNDGITAVCVKKNGTPVGYIGLFDPARDEARSTMAQLHDKGLELCIISGDQESAVKTVAEDIGIPSYFARLKPDEKMAKIKGYTKGDLVYIGDGVNDAPALKAADAGIAMGLKGSDVALETADIVLLNDKLSLLPFLIDLSRRMSATIKINIAISLAINVLSLIAGAMGLLTPILGAVSHNIGSIAVVLLSASISFTNPKAD